MNFWKNKKILITGHTGFKGSWLTLWLRHRGAEVFGISLPPNSLSLYNIADIGAGITSHIQDITQADELTLLVQTIEPEIIFHLAAQALVRPSYDDPVSTFSTNMMGTVNLLDAARQCDSVRTIVVVTSDKCYENKEWQWGYRETDHLGGYDPYSCSKACTELIVNSFRKSFFEKSGINVATARAGNVIGGGDWGENRLVPDLLAGFSKNEKVIIRYPEAIRPWQHVCEPLNGYLYLAQKMSENGWTFSEAWNFGPLDGSNKTVRWIADYLQKKWPNSIPWTTTYNAEPHESMILKLDIGKALDRLDWHPVLSVSQALDWTVNWYKEYLEKSDMGEITLNQINKFIEISKK